MAETWEKIYKTNLTTELNKEGVKDLFLETIATGSTGTGGTGGTGSTGVIKYGSIVVAVGDNYNLRSADFKVERKTKTNEVFTVTTVANNKTIAGVTGTWYAVKTSEFTVLPPYYFPSWVNKSYWIFQGGIKLKK